MKKQKQSRHDAGFTLVELSIVLVVIGLLIGSVLVALTIIQNARVTSAVSTLQSIQSAVSTYSQNFSAQPGDDKTATTRFPSSNVPANGGGDGTIGTSTLTKSFDNATAGTGGNGAAESALVWSHLRAAGLIKGEGSQATPAANPFGGVFGVQNGAFTTDGIALGTNVVCASKVPGTSARIIDQRLDDGVATTGIVRGGTDVTAAAAAYDDTSSFIVCMGL